MNQAARIVATHGTAGAIQAAGVPCEGINKVKEGRPHCVDLIKNGGIQFIANTTEGKTSIEESRSIRGGRSWLPRRASRPSMSPSGACSIRAMKLWC